MGKHNRYAPQPQLQPLPKPLSPPPAPPIVDDEDELGSSEDESMVEGEGLQTTDPEVIARVDEIAEHNMKALEEMNRSIPGMQKRPARYIAMTGLLYTNREGVRREVAISEAVDDLNREDLEGYLQRGHVAPETDNAEDD